MNIRDTKPESCARCGVPIGSWKTERGGLYFCSFYCSRQAPPPASEQDRDELPPEPPPRAA